MRRTSPKALAVVGCLGVALGAVGAMVFAVAQSSCQDGPGGLVPNPSLASHCAADAWGSRIGYIVLVMGALLVLLAGIRATPRFSGAAQNPEGDEASGDEAGGTAVAAPTRGSDRPAPEDPVDRG